MEENGESNYVPFFPFFFIFERKLTGYKTIGYSSQNASLPNQAMNFELKTPELAYQMEQMT